MPSLHSEQTEESPLLRITPASSKCLPSGLTTPALASIQSQNMLCPKQQVKERPHLPQLNSLKPFSDVPTGTQVYTGHATLPSLLGFRWFSSLSLVVIQQAPKWTTAAWQEELPGSLEVVACWGDVLLTGQMVWRSSCWPW